MLELQSCIGNDSRFQLDSRFYESEAGDRNISDPGKRHFTFTYTLYHWLTFVLQLCECNYHDMFIAIFAISTVTLSQYFILAL